MLSQNQVCALVPRVKRAAFDKLKTIAFMNNGTVFGGAVREAFIVEYYTSMFFKEDTSASNKPNRFWDASYLPHTKARLLVPDDMDLSFSTAAEADKFIEEISKIKDFSNVEVTDVTDENKYYSSAIRSIKEVVIELDVLSPMLMENKTVTIKADVILTKYKNTQPPFRNLDMLCNGFIERKDTGKTFSRHTGTVIDHYSDYERSIVVAQILKDLISFKTALCFSSSSMRGRFSRNIVAMKRIEKMEKKKLGWEFINMPFETKIYKELTSETQQQDACHAGDASKEFTECPIWTSEFKHGDKIAYTTSNKEDKTIACPYIHYKCCMKHLKQQMRDAPLHHTSVFVFRCPFRNIITFNRCSLDIQFLYKLDM